MKQDSSITNIEKDISKIKLLTLGFSSSFTWFPSQR